ncbi:MAG TPA: aldo/keto reductase [Hyphomicrobiaceae bacterium]|nr:aldo/keto reductase [Hyphomicrobiaceae bacterium]
MQTRTLGRAKPLEVPAIGLGCMGMTPIYGTPDPASGRAAIARAVELGAAFLDSSDAYADGKNEELIGKAIKGIRDRVIVATKFGNLRFPDGTRGVCGRPDYVIEACNRSLARLGVDVIDLYYQHRVDPNVPIEETVGAMARLVEQGKVRYLGLSEAGPKTIRRAHATHPITALQTEYSLFTRDVEAEILPLCRELGIGFVAYAPLGRGVLTGSISGLDSLAENDRRREHPRFQADNLANNLKLVAPLKEVAARYGATPGQVALAWLLSRGPDIVPIPGTSKPARVEENLATLDKPIDKAALEELTVRIDAKQVAGLRYPAGQMKSLGI